MPAAENSASGRGNAVGLIWRLDQGQFLARDVIHTSRAYAMMPVRLSVTEVHWRIIANLGFKFRSHFTAHYRKQHVLLAVLLAGGSSRAILASARLSCSSLSLESCALRFLQRSLAART